MQPHKTHAQQNYQNLCYQGSQADADRFLRAIAQQEPAKRTFGPPWRHQRDESVGNPAAADRQRALDYYWQQLTQLVTLLKMVNPGMNTNLNTSHDRTRPPVSTPDQANGLVDHSPG